MKAGVHLVSPASSDSPEISRTALNDIKNISILNHEHHINHNLPIAIMVNIYGSNFLSARPVSRALQSFYGIGPQICTQLMARFHIHKTCKVGALSDRQINNINAELQGMTLENDLRRQLVENIKRLRDMGTYRGRRHAMGLPVRGQRTRTQIQNARKLNRIDRKG